LEIKLQDASQNEHPYALVDIKKAQKQYSLVGCSYGADGVAGVPWPSGPPGTLDVNMKQGSTLIHCFETTHNNSKVTGLSYYDFADRVAARPQDGRGFYAQQSDGSTILSRRVDFILKKVTPELRQYYLQHEAEAWSDSAADRKKLIRKIHRERLYRRIVLTGGSYSGKTTLIERLHGAGYSTIKEAALEIIDSMKGEKGEAGYHSWRESHYPEFQQRIFERQKINDGLHLNGPLPSQTSIVFMDRSAIDCIAYLERKGLTPPADMVAYARQMPLTEVFVLDTIEPFDPRSHTGRESTKQDSLELRDRLLAVYSRFGFSPQLLPQLTEEQRVQYICESIQSKLA
jgi:predicted ATPase